MLDDLILAVRAGHPVAALQCEEMISPGEMTQAACLQAVSRLSAANASSAYLCNPPPAGISSCYSVSSDGFSIRFEFRGNGADPSRIVAEPEILVADLLID